jgi:two-component system sensor histidine kinase MtrB
LARSRPRPWRWLRQRLRRPGLRARITISFALGALLLSVLLATVTFILTRRNLVDQRESQALSQTTIDARNLKNQIGTADVPSSDLNADLASLVTPSGSWPVLRVQQANGDELWLSTNAQYGRDALPAGLRTAVQRGTPARMRYRRNGEVELAVGIPIPGINGSYFEIVSLKEVDDTLRTLGVSLLGAAAVTTVAGALLGWAVSRRALRPLADMTLAAEAIAGGQLDARVDQAGDSDLESLVESFNGMAATLEARIERDARFASDVSHELRSPLMTISASVEVLNSRRDELPDGPMQSALDLMVADIARFRQLVEDLLEISRFDAGAARLDLQEVRLAELVLQAVSFSSANEIPIDLDAELAGVIVRVDKLRLVRVLANLLDNAAKYGGGATRVALEHTDANKVHLIVEDRGPGVPPDERDHVFDRFSRGVSAGRRTGSEGVGLGLSLVAEHVRLHGGRVWVTDRLDGRSGARFVIELPVNPA